LHLSQQYPKLEVAHRTIACQGGLDYQKASQAIEEIVVEYDQADVSFLPNLRDPLWNGAAVALWSHGKLPPVMDELIPRQGYPVSQCFYSFSNSRASDVAMPEEVFADDLALKLGLIGEHPLFLQTLKHASMLADSDFPILLLGQSGTGKGVLARYIHGLSNRANGPFVALNCAALPEALAESILFGHEKGAFTGALKEHFGKFKQADGGTLFLDEIGDLPLPIQGKLLRAIEEYEIEALGASKSEMVNIRIIAATNKNLKQAIEEKAFREDLYYRLRVGELTIPSLAERPSDIAMIAQFLLNRINKGFKKSKILSAQAIHFLEKQPWPGNIRDLNNTLARAALLTDREALFPDDFDLSITSPTNEAAGLVADFHPGFSLEEYLSTLRAVLMRKALDQSLGNQSHAARLLGVTPQAVNRFVLADKNRLNLDQTPS
jgi:transcriptional regulator with PAS, ATPase and Fis domain